MHLFKFNEDQKKAFLGLAKSVMNADKEVSINESSFLLLMKKEMGLNADVKIEDKSMDELLLPFNNVILRAWLIQELFSMGYVDKFLAPEELEMIQNIAQKIGFTRDEVEQIRLIAIKNEELVKDLNKLIKAKQNL